MIRIARALWDGLRLRCPHCRRGRMFASWFTMRDVCPVCGTRFERSSGEVTGGMGINVSLTLLLVIVGAALVLFNPDLPLIPLMLSLMLFAIIFPIAFYPVSRGLWASILYLTGDNEEPD